MVSDKHTPLGPGREFDAIRAWLASLGDAASGAGDDAAVLDVPAGSKLVVSTDSSIEGEHFRREWLSPAEIGYRACAAALSDLAAMGAAPLGVLVAIGVSARWRDDAAAVMQGIGEAAQHSGTVIVGGDTAGGDALTIGVTVLGHAARPLPRSRAQPGDIIYVTGKLGGPNAALRAWLSGRAPDSTHRARFVAPRPRIAAGLRAAAAGAHAAIDISDGLAADLRHMAAASGVSIEVDLRAVPVLSGATLDDALGGGEEYELAIAAPSLDTEGFEAAGTPLTAIGAVRAGPAGVTGLKDGARVALPGGYDHFSS
ncbi:MAG: thiamine-phosphate kinase [Gemmatimonadetes bacterium]|nr:thiamine-phosphate kinase [Gemmatimonadota bacterium]